MENSGKKSSKDELYADEQLDLRGKICPMTFVYTKLALEKISRGKILKLTLDFPPALKNVPDTINNQNLGRVIGEHQDGKVKTLWIQKGD